MQDIRTRSGTEHQKKENTIAHAHLLVDKNTHHKHESVNFN